MSYIWVACRNPSQFVQVRCPLQLTLILKRTRAQNYFDNGQPVQYNQLYSRVTFMIKETVQDRWSNDIYITEERWRHILARHAELTGLFHEVLETLQRGRRRQEALDPHRYRHLYATLPPEFSHIVVAVVFRYKEQPDGTRIPNNFVTSAWGVDIYGER